MKMEDLLTRVYSQEEIDDGVVLNAAILMKDPSKASQTLAAIDTVSEREAARVQDGHLAAGRGHARAISSSSSASCSSARCR